MDPAQNPPVSPPPLPPQPPVPGGIVPTEIPIAEAKKLEHHGRFLKKKKLIVIITTIICVIVLLLSLPIMLSKPAPPAQPTPKPTPTPTPYQSTILPIDRNHSEQILINQVPHFLDLKLSDIPSIFDIKGIFNYKNNLIIVSTGSIVEYNPKTLDIVRQNDASIFSCINNATVIGIKLFVSCNGFVNSKSQPKGIYVINLENGKLEKIYKQGSAVLDTVSVAALDTTLWVGSANKVVKIDVTTDHMNAYTPIDMGTEGCANFTVYGYAGSVWVTCSPGITSAVSLYDSKKDTWSPFTPPNIGGDSVYTLGYNEKAIYFLTTASTPTLYTYHRDTSSWDQTSPTTLRVPSSKPEAAEMRGIVGQSDVIFKELGQRSIAYLSYFDTVQKKVVDFELIVNPYIALSDVVNEKRYLFTNRTVDKLKEGGFPSAYKKLNGTIASAVKMTVDPSENYAVFIGPQKDGNPPFTVQLVILKTGEVVDPLKSNQELQYMKPERLAEISTNIPTYTLLSTTKEAKLADPKTGNTLMIVNFKDKTVSVSGY
jgi:hypothetical protein